MTKHTDIVSGDDDFSFDVDVGFRLQKWCVIYDDEVSETSPSIIAYNVVHSVEGSLSMVLSIKSANRIEGIGNIDFNTKEIELNVSEQLFKSIISNSNLFSGVLLWYRSSSEDGERLESPFEVRKITFVNDQIKKTAKLITKDFKKTKAFTKLQNL